MAFGPVEQFTHRSGPIPKLTHRQSVSQAGLHQYHHGGNRSKKQSEANLCTEALVVRIPEKVTAQRNDDHESPS